MTADIILAVKGAIQFHIDKPVPRKLVSGIVRFREKENTRALRSR